MTAVLIANRGEIAVRVVAACRRLGLTPVVAVSDADRDSLAAQLADRAICVGPAPAPSSYLRAELMVEAALATGATLLHPGYGFLSEQPALAEACEDNGIAFVGPRPDSLRAVGDKASARAVAEKAGVPVAPGAVVLDETSAVRAAREIGFPLLVKAVHGGGGRGITLVRDESELVKVLPVAAAEAQAGFGNGALYLERFYAAARHVEVQVFGDGEGGVAVLGERDCSVQRRHQKLIEECPAPGLSLATRDLLRTSAARLVEQLRYRGAGTVEFVLDTESTADPQTIVFLEMNARIQVEHPVTEEAYGVDLVAAQLRLALGEPHGLPDDPPEPAVHVLECRLNAEDPYAGFRPAPGRITRVTFPRGPGIRIESHVYEGYLLPPYYDSLLGKVIVRARNRVEAIDAMLAAVRATEINGVTTTAPLHEFVLAHPDFRASAVETRWLDTVWPPASASGTVSKGHAA
ncbi:acetyl-CoA carboxylase biotin carboxylase subunit [Sphaerisporangium perillae]|uniref:acetyl-CoA carboxylase biotin carboxylase subunit n=1 Tax=Sphaerisporangium perillae TaxID=2935860 RepID=UPI00200F4223|nr:biotin carboxylase N-terminal domain-containing protein [Sphaerisporangium perillae]